MKGRLVGEWVAKAWGWCGKLVEQAWLCMGKRLVLGVHGVLVWERGFGKKISVNGCPSLLISEKQM